MSELLPEVLQVMLKHARETHASGDIARAETEYLLALDYSQKLYHEASATTGLVLMQLAEFYESSQRFTKAAIALGRASAILAAYNKTVRN